jgi:hypothetical protein
MNLIRERILSTHDPNYSNDEYDCKPEHFIINGFSVDKSINTLWLTLHHD